MMDKQPSATRRFQRRIASITKTQSENSKEQRKSNLNIAVLGMLLCLSGNITQVYHINSQYFRYAITTNVQVVIEDTILLPTATYCFSLVHVINWEKLTHEERVGILQDDLGADIYDYNVEDEDEESVKMIPLIIKANIDIVKKIQVTSNLQKLNMSRVFDVTYKLEYMFEWVSTYVEDYSPTGTSRTHVFLSFVDSTVDEILTISEFIKDIYRCYSLEYKKEYRLVNYHHLARQATTPGVISIASFNRDRINNTLEMYFVPSHDERKPATGFYGTFPTASTASQIQHVTYDIFEARLLKAPYETRCIHYSDFGFQFRGECFESCLRNESISKTGKVHPSVNIFKEETKNIVTISEILFNNNNTGTLMNEMQDMCDQRCQAKDCVSFTYVPKKLTSQIGPDINFALLANLAPQSPIVRSTCLQTISFIQYLTDIASAFGFWLGVSAIGSLEFAKGTFKRASERLLRADSANRKKKEDKQSQRRQIKVTEEPSSVGWVLLRGQVVTTDLVA